MLLSLITFRKIYIVQTRDAMHRHTAEADSIHDPEDEQQRQQLLRLLQQRDSTKKVSSEASETFRIDLPDSIRRSGTHLSAPSNIYERRSRNQQPTITYNNWPTYTNPITPIIMTEPPVPEIPHGSDVNHPLDPLHTHPAGAVLPHGGGGGGGDGGGGADFGVPGIVNTRYPVSKAEEAGYSLGTPSPLLHERHPLEREQQQPRRPQYRMETEEEQDRRRRSLSRESRRVEIEMVSRGARPPEKKETGRGPTRGELEGVEVVQRIARVETDGWERRGGQ